MDQQESKVTTDDMVASHQYGSFGSADISADGVVGDVGWHPAMVGHPRIAASFGYASGDSNPRDDRLGTFEAEGSRVVLLGPF